MELVWQTSAWEDYCHWQKQDKKILARVNELIKDCLRSPYKGIGKPEPLKGNYAGCWSRRITQEHRLIYKINEQRLHILQCRYHCD
jgi:toxin YoeB